MDLALRKPYIEFDRKPEGIAARRRWTVMRDRGMAAGYLHEGNIDTLTDLMHLRMKFRDMMRDGCDDKAIPPVRNLIIRLENRIDYYAWAAGPRGEKEEADPILSVVHGDRA